MAIIFSPLPPFDSVITVTAICAITVIIIYAVLLRLNRLPSFASSHVFGQKGKIQTAAISLSLISLLLLIPTAHNPIWVEHQKTTGPHVVLTIDVSESILRSFDDWQNFKLHINQQLTTLAQYQGPLTQDKGVVSLVLFTEQTSVVWQHKAFGQMITNWQQVDQSDIPAGIDTSIENGLNSALEVVESVGRPSAIVLFTDGHQISGNARAITKQIADSGTPIYPIAINARLPAVAIKATNLIDTVIVEQTTYLRSLLVNNQKQPMTGDLTVTQNLGNQDAKQSKSTVTLAAAGQGIIRLPVDFQKRGLNHLTLAFDQQGNNQPHIRRLYTLVKGPVKILSIAGDRRWESALPQAAITPVDALSLSIDTPFSDYDGIVISAVAATDFQPGVLNKIATAVNEQGTGLLLINGAQYVEDKPTVLMSYQGTPIEPLLPVSSEPRPEDYEPPARNIVIMIDTSGSMKGPRLLQAKAIARHIINTYMRPQDSLDLITFSTGAQHLVNNDLMDPSGKQRALQKLTGIVAGGGTNPTNALGLVDGRTMDECGLIFISDGEFGAISARPDCAATAFGIGMSPNFASSISAIADPIYVNETFNPQRIKIKYFEPQTRDKFFELGSYTPGSIQWRSHLASSVPALKLQGSAISYLRKGAELVAIRPKWRDPILTYIQRGNGYVGFFATALPPSWLNNTMARQAVKQWIDEILPFSEQQRYDIKIADLGDRLRFTLSVFNGNQIARLDNIQALITAKDQQPLTMAFTRHPEEAGTFVGELKLDEVTNPGAGMLYINETGKDAVARQQRIPINLVTTQQVRQTLSEDFASGINHRLLQKLAFETGGQVLHQLNQSLVQYKPLRTKEQPLWSLFAAVAMLLYLAAIAVTRLES